jgi:hypothetical protein
MTLRTKNASTILLSMGLFAIAALLGWLVAQ